MNPEMKRGEEKDFGGATQRVQTSSLSQSFLPLSLSLSFKNVFQFDLPSTIIMSLLSWLRYNCSIGVLGESFGGVI